MMPNAWCLHRGVRFALFIAECLDCDAVWAREDGGPWRCISPGRDHA